MLTSGNVSSRQLFWLLLILLAAAGLRLHRLVDVPPGLTHDEADHGLDAWRIREGERPLYLTTANGREPLYDYATALLMAAIGRQALAGRLTSVFFSLIFLAATYGWTRKLFDNRIALWSCAGLAFGFWPLMVSRHMLRTISLPALFSLALFFYLHGRGRSRWTSALAAGLCLGLTFYSYIPARGLWLLFPLLTVYWLLTRAQGRPGPSRLLLTLLPAGLISWPLWRYLQRNPGAEARLGQLSEPLRAAGQGDFDPLWQNLQGSLALFSLVGDGAWRYNLAGRPWLGPLASLLFYAGLLLAIWYLARRDRRFGAGSLLALGLLAIGFAPAAITGPELATTQAIGLLPVLYLFPALALAAGGRWLDASWPASKRWASWLIGGGFLLLAVGSSQAYFGDWANRPEVRLQYESTLVAMLEALAATDTRGAAISTAEPGPFHAQAVAALILAGDPGRHFWFDGRSSLVRPAEGAPLLTAGLAPLHPTLIGLFVPGGPDGEIPTRASDLDRPIRQYAAGALQTVPAGWQAAATVYQFGDAVQFLGYWLATDQVAAGAVVPILTGWQVLTPPAEEWVLFTHLTGPDGVPLAQQDLLGVPSAGWQPGEVFYQLHELSLPADLPAGRYQLRTGFYYCPVNCQQGAVRLPLSLDGTTLGDNLNIADLAVTP